MGQDITHVVNGLGSKKVLLGISFEQLVLILYPLFLIPAVYFWYHDVRRRRFVSTLPSGCTKLEMRGKSNNADELDSKYDHGTDDQHKWRVKAIYIHPIKSCAPIELDIADVDAEGMTYDRKFGFAEWLKPTVIKSDASEEEKKPRWTFRTLRQPGYEKLALVKPEVWIPKAVESDAQGTLRRVEQEGALIIRYPNEPTGFLAPLDRLMISWGLVPKENSFQIPLNPKKGHKYPKESIDVWKDNPTWINMGEHLPNDFQKWLGVKHPLAIFRADPERYRQVFRCAPRKADIGFQPVIGFQDAYPLNLQNLASVHDLANRIDTIDRFSVRRFRGNIILEGPPAYNEDDWKTIKIGGNKLYCVCHTMRCRLPNVDPDTAIRYPTEPDKTLKSFRCIDPGDPKNAALGMQLVPASNEHFQIRVGDSIEVLERGEHFYINYSS